MSARSIPRAVCAVSPATLHPSLTGPVHADACSYEYDTLACALRDALLADAHAFDADRLVVVDEGTVARWVGNSSLNQMQERMWKLREVSKRHAMGVAVTASAHSRLLAAALRFATW